MTCSSDVLGALFAPQKASADDAKDDDVGLLRQRLILQLLRQLPQLPSQLSTTIFQLLQCGVLTKDVVSDVLDVGPRLMQLQDRPSQALDTAAAGPPAPCLKPGLPPSRFMQDFQYVEPLGQGSYGEVWRCRHRLDGQDYAVKKVEYRSAGAQGPAVEERALREAQTWASISHPNIVRYHSAWVEVDWDTLASAPQRLDKPQPLPLEDATSESGGSGSSEEDVSDGGVVFLDASKEVTGEPEPSEEALPETGVLAKRPREPANAGIVYKATLYIQTELCSKETLQSWIHQRNVAVAAGNASKEDLKVWAKQAAEIFRQVASALAKLHGNGLAHRDLKPSNILFGADGGVRLGDFGLAKLLDGALKMDGASDPQVPPRLRRSCSKGVGTPTYASPEQFSTGSYGVKTDIFALGVILAELLCPAATQMERSALFERLRSGEGLAHEVAQAFPKAASLVEAMTHHEAENRPSAADLLENVVVGEICEQIAREA